MTIYAVGFMALYAAAFVRPAPRAVATVALVATLALNVVAMLFITDRISRSWVDVQYGGQVPRLVRDAGVVPGDSVAEESSITWWVNVRHQREVSWTSVSRFEPTGAPPDGVTVVIAKAGKGADWDGNAYGYTLQLSYDEGGWGTWAVWRKQA
jgi:hypothetical protein